MAFLSVRSSWASTPVPTTEILDSDMSRKPLWYSRSAGTFGLVGAIRNALSGPSQQAIQADIAAVDRGEARVISACLFRGLYGAYPRRFRAMKLELLASGLVVSSHWWAIPRRRFVIRESIGSANVRERNPKTDWNVRSGGMYAAGSTFQWSGSDVIICKTSLGVLEFAVPRVDVALVLHFINALGG